MRALLPLLLAGCPRVPAPPMPPPPRPVWIDTDPTVGVPGRDVDDGVALLQALGSPELAVRGVSVTFANGTLEQTAPVARALVDAWAPGLPLHVGAAEPGLDASDASKAIIAALEAEPLAILALGAATNVATALHARPDLAPRATVIAVAGRRPGQRLLPGPGSPHVFRDLNFEKDPGAFEVLLALGVDLVLAPWEVSSHVRLHEEHVARLADGPRSARLAEPTRAWLQLWADRFLVEGFNPFDTLAVGWLVRSDLMRCTPGRARIALLPNDIPDSSVAAKPFLLVDDGPGATVTYCHDVDETPFVDDLLHRLLR